MDNLDKIVSELIEYGKTLSYQCRVVLNSTIEQSYLLYDNEIYVVTFIENKPVSIVLK